MDAAEAYAESVGYKDENDLCATLNVFCAGWRAADNSRWIPVDRELPKPNIYQDCKTFPLVLVCLNDGCEDTDAYDTDNKAWCKYDSDVEYWMEMPPVPRKEGKNDH